MTEVHWDFHRGPRPWKGQEVWDRYALSPEKIELIEGKIFWDDDERLRMIGLLLENVGLDKVVRMGDPKVWREAIAALDRGEPENEKEERR